MDIIETIANELHLTKDQTQRTVDLIDDGNTIPFIARYRKEVTGALDDTTLRTLQERLQYLRNLEKRKEEVVHALSERGKLTDTLSNALTAAQTLSEVEELYRPYKQKKKTRADLARERGLEVLAKRLSEQLFNDEKNLMQLAQQCVAQSDEIETIEEAFAGAQDIIAEEISNRSDVRKKIYDLTMKYGFLSSKAAKNAQEDSVYQTYYDYAEKLSAVAQHRVLAVNRGEKDGFLKVSILIDDAIVQRAIASLVHIDSNASSAAYLQAAVEDSYTRLIAPSVERQIRSELTQAAEQGATKIFAENLKNLLMQAPLKGKTVLGYDPGYRTGCKLAVVDAVGKVLDTAVIYPTKPKEDIPNSAKTLLRLIDQYHVDVIAIGNGTASGESELFVAQTLKQAQSDVKYVIVSEAGASVYSASKLGAEEFPDFDVTQRSAVSIARRLQDPLAELVKIDPKSIGVGQYQHDIKQSYLDEALDGVVEDCVNAVGVDINTASRSLMSFIAGINASAAANVVKYREEHGAFHTRQELLEVNGIGPKAYLQCAGFCRVPESKEILDNTGIHPESYSAAKRLVSLLTEDEKETNASLRDIAQKATEYGIERLAEKLEIGLPTLQDILTELQKPGRDIRETLPPPVLRTEVLTIEDLKPDMVLEGVVRNVTDFGAFVDIGVHQDGLVHVSKISDRFIRHPSEVLKVGDRVKVKVLSVDVPKHRIGLTMRF